MSIKKLANSLIIIFVLFLSKTTTAQSKSEVFIDALNNGTPKDVVIAIENINSLKNTNKYLYEATLNPNLNYVKENYTLLLSKGYTYNEYEYLTAVYLAIDKNKIELLKFLISQPEWNIEENQSDIFQRAYIELEEDTFDTEPSSLEVIINNNLDLNSWKTKQHIFEFAKRCYDGRNEEKSKNAFKKLASFGIDLNIRHPSGSSIVHKAAYSASEPDSILKFFKDLGANTLLKNKRNETAESIVFKTKLLHIIKFENAKNFDSILRKEAVLYEERYLYLLANNATKNTVFEKYKTLRNFGYKPNINYISNGDDEIDYAFRVAIDSNVFSLRDFIFKSEKSLQHKNKLDHFYESAIFSLDTLSNIKESNIQFLIDKGLNVNSIKNKNTLLEVSFKSNSEKQKNALKHLVSLFPVDMNFQNKEGNNILHLIAERGYDFDFSFFEKLGVDPNVKNNDGYAANEIHYNILKERNRKSEKQRNTPKMLILLSVLSLILSIIYRKKINTVLLRLVVSFIDTLSITYIIATLFTMLNRMKESPLEIMILTFAFGTLIFIPIFLIVQYLIFKFLKKTKFS